MAKGRKETERAGWLRAAYAAGDHGAARRRAAEILADPAAQGDERDAALEIRRRTAPDPGVVIAAVGGAVTAVALFLWLVLR